jgi:ABC-type hemin transport system substrate-binding protein
VNSSQVRVVSLVPSATETLLALGADVVACTRFCEQPQLRHVGGTKNPDVAAIVALSPDVVVVDEEENRREDAEALSAAGLEVLVTAVRDVGGAREATARLAARCRRPGPVGEEWPASDPPPAHTAFVPIWRRPWMTINADTYGAAVLRSAGVDVITAGWRERYPTVELAAVGRPDLVLVPSEPYAFSAAHVADLAAAFPSAAVLRVDGQDLFWWGVRTPGAVGRLAEQVRSATSSS